MVVCIGLVRLWLDYLRIKHTEYRIYPNKIETTSYVFPFLGVYNNVANLSELRTIQASTNSIFDVRFFKCGYVTLIVSGDRTKFVVHNVYQPGRVRRQIEEIVFGKGSVEYGADLTPEFREEA